MHDLLASFLFAAPNHRVAAYGFVLVAVPLLGLMAVDMRRASKASAQKKDRSMKFMSRYRDENGMPIFFEAGEDPSARAAHRVLTQMQRGGANRAGDTGGQ
ncbi:MAG TPA: hypothetical protein VMR02_20115 [Terracidiphilus sp.]|jgi:hypothetical protein|nr:hypothetical protein [Terracidiphilus sp.]